MWTLTGLLRGMLNRPVKIFWAYFGHIYIFCDVLFWFKHVRCLNRLKFGHRFNFWDRNFFGALWAVRCVIFQRHFDHIWPAILYRTRSRTGQRAHDSKCLNEVYKAYVIIHISNKKFLVKLNWVKIRQILEGQYCPPPLDLMLIWKFGPERVNGTEKCSLTNLRHFKECDPL